MLVIVMYDSLFVCSSQKSKISRCRYLGPTKTRAQVIADREPRVREPRKSKDPAAAFILVFLGLEMENSSVVSGSPRLQYAAHRTSTGRAGSPCGKAEIRDFLTGKYTILPPIFQQPAWNREQCDNPSNRV